MPGPIAGSAETRVIDYTGDGVLNREIVLGAQYDEVRVYRIVGPAAINVLMWASVWRNWQSSHEYYAVNTPYIRIGGWSMEKGARFNAGRTSVLLCSASIAAQSANQNLKAYRMVLKRYNPVGIG